jgi:hypothetical protein
MLEYGDLDSIDMEWWNNGRLEYWNFALRSCAAIISSFQCSNFPGVDFIAKSIEVKKQKTLGGKSL